MSEIKLRAMHFMPNVTVSIGGRHNAITHWDRGKHQDDQPNGAKIRCELQKNGDAWLITDDGRRRVVSALAIAWTLWEGDDVKGLSAVPEPKRS
jgi:hypothetical protein